ncbi:glutaredoxin domain-containing protein [Undibacterium sp. Ji67W]|uniref:glutaredoxin domain-containing protein n=1 Tax=Undibacterium sp. Ji67W TaxID=3413042 RepID=UPI003BF34273
MTRICPKCNYIRKETDDCPEWQCPACQVAYMKAGDDKLMSRISEQRQNHTPSTTSHFNLWKYLLVAILIGGVSIQSYSSWHQKQLARRAMLENTQSNQNGQPLVVLYGTSWCGYCAAARTFFSENGIQFKDLDIEKSQEASEAYKNLGGGGVPVILIGDVRFKGFSEAHLREELAPWIHKG